MKQLIVLSLFIILSQPLWAADKIRIYITDVPIETIRSSGSVSISDWLKSATGRSTTSIQAKSFVADAMKHLRELKECKNYIATVNQARAQYVFFIEAHNEYRENIVVYTIDGDVIYAGETLRLKNNIKDACKELNEFE